jgi:DNA-binding LacI/PurR family transcriptional regulator
VIQIVSKYRKIEEYLINLIRNNRLKPGDKLPTEFELMSKFNVSRETVRKAIRRLVVEGLVYRKPGVGTFVSEERKNKLIGICVQQITSYIFPYIVLGAEDEAFNNGYKLLLGNGFEDPSKERQILIDWKNSGIKGMIIDPVCSALQRSNRELIKRFVEEGLKIVLINSDLEIDGTSVVVLDDFYGGQKAAEVFYENGHKRVAVLYKSTHLPSILRAQGFVHKGKELGFEKIYERSFHPSEFTGIPIDHAHELLSLPPSERPTGVFCYNDVTALQFYMVAKRYGLGVPDDLSLIGFDDAPIGDFRWQLSTFSHPKEEMGRKAVEILLKMLNGEISDIKHMIKPEFIMRKSVSKFKGDDNNV